MRLARGLECNNENLQFKGDDHVLSKAVIPRIGESKESLGSKGDVVQRPVRCRGVLPSKGVVVQCSVGHRGVLPYIHTSVVRFRHPSLDLLTALPTVSMALPTIYMPKALPALRCLREDCNIWSIVT